MSAAVSPQEVADVLLRARERMNKRGKHWIQGDLERRQDGELCYCSLGAIYAETKAGPLRNAALRALSDSIKASGFNRIRWGEATTIRRRIYWWNDTTYRKWGDVSKMFRLAAREVLKGAK